MAMQLTPSAKSAFIAGGSLSIIGWLSLLKLDALAKFFHVNRFVKQEGVFRWINANRSLALLFTEFFNYGVHGISNSESTTFALGSTVVNAIMIFLGVPAYQKAKNKKHGPRVVVMPKRSAA